MIPYFVLWFVITGPLGHLWHIPMEDQYTTLETCEAAKPELEGQLRTLWPFDFAINVYCEEFPKPTKL